MGNFNFVENKKTSSALAVKLVLKDLRGLYFVSIFISSFTGQPLFLSFVAAALFS